MLDAVEDGYELRLANAALRAEQAHLLVAVDPDTDEALGTVTFCLPGGPWAEISRTGEAEFRMLAVAPEARGRGAGRALVEECLRRAAAAGAGRLVLSTQPSSAVAHRLYERLGFSRLPERDWSPAPGVDLLAYARPAP
ncbi:GNAT family N-acetyltransferase [Motilibacter sp. E257]|uniref:GNAT family N-acetyltransferase n=2 Tax=Motilibacter deserti TaxID=2714956 RepID=A0ABX0GR70_9ACTN|nr:GNAT family N-acetyltransferase [Motilibacter deserti]NHC13354.1 GNAT family N-acetyltransferase [Motilibacter deserti]